MADEQIKVGLAIVSDSAGTSKARQDLAVVRKEIENLKTAFNNGDKSASEFSKELAKLESQEKSIKGAINAVTGEYTREATAMKQAAVEAKRLAVEQAKAERAGFEMGLGQFGPDPAAKTTAGAGLRAAGRNLRNLPSVQIPGLGIGTDAIGNITRLTGAIADVSEKSKASAKAASIAAAASKTLGLGLEAQTIASIGAYAPIALLTAGFVVIAAGLKRFVDTTSANADQINSFAENQRDLNDKIAGGLTTEQAQEELDKLTEAQERNRGTLGQLQGAYDSSQQQLGALGGLVKVFSGDEEALANQINETNKTIGEQQGKMDALEGALKDGSLAANDAAIAEKKLAEERTAAVLENAAAAGQEAAARNKADAATAEQNQSRLKAIEDEKEAINAQLSVLQSSGDTSEKVSDQIEKLNGQLHGLGKESEYISKTALAASKARDAEKKAQKEAEDAAKKTQAAQDKYADSVKNAGRTFQQSAQDIKTKLGQSLADNLTSLLRDGTDIATKYQRETVDLSIKASRDERDALQDHYRSVQDIQDDALKSREEALQEGDFKQAFLAQKAGQDALKEEQKKVTRGAEDRRTALNDERSDLLTNAGRERSDRLLAFERQNADNRLAADRELAQAKLAKQRSLSMASEALNAELKLHQNYWSARNAMTAQGLQQGKTTSTGANLPTGKFATAQFATLAPLAGIIRK